VEGGTSCTTKVVVGKETKSGRGLSRDYIKESEVTNLDARVVVQTSSWQINVIIRHWPM
jgi:hypothetical protein